MGKMEDYQAGRLDPNDPWVVYGRQQGWLPKRTSLEAALPVAQAPERKRTWGGKPVDTRRISYTPQVNTPFEARQAAQELAETPKGLIEGGLSAGTGMLAAPVAGLAGIGELARTGDPAKATQRISDVSQDLTYEPRTKTGKGVSEALNKPFELYGRASEGMGEVGEEYFGVPRELTSGFLQAAPVALGGLKSAYPKEYAAGMSKLGQAVVSPMSETFAGVKAANAPLGLLEKAKQLEAAGVADKEIWAQTGWTKGFPDKQWRWEISDDAAKMNPKYANDPQGNILAEALQHEPAYTAYPETAEIRYEKTGLTSDYNPSTNTIRAAGGAKSPTIHELQHAVQEREGFARGGNPEQFNFAKQQPKIAARYNEISEEMTKRILDTGRADFENDPVLVRLTAEKQGYEKSFPDLLKSPTTQYRSLAGEAEARLTQKRMDLTPEQRRAQYPISEFDVPPEQQIVRGVPGAVAELHGKMRDPKSKALLEKRYPELSERIIYSGRGPMYEPQMEGVTWWTPSKTIADAFAKHRGGDRGYVVERNLPQGRFLELGYDVGIHPTMSEYAKTKLKPSEKAIAKAKKEGYDGIIWKNVEDRGGVADQYILFEP